MFAVNNIVQVEPGKTLEHNGVIKSVGSMELSINFENVQVRQVDTESEEIHDLSVQSDAANKQKAILQDINLPANCRK